MSAVKNDLNTIKNSSNRLQGLNSFPASNIGDSVEVASQEVKSESRLAQTLNIRGDGNLEILKPNLTSTTQKITTIMDSSVNEKLSV